LAVSIVEQPDHDRQNSRREPEQDGHDRGPPGFDHPDDGLAPQSMGMEIAP
jgi:hypothetical protein